MAGIDVGGPRKGFHAVALRGGEYVKFASTEAADVASWCLEQGAQFIGVDAPCRWSVDGRSRPAEVQLRAAGIQSFSTPLRETALTNASDFYGWMLNGEKMFALLERAHQLYRGEPRENSVPSGAVAPEPSHPVHSSPTSLTEDGETCFRLPRTSNTLPVISPATASGGGVVFGAVPIGPPGPIQTPIRCEGEKPICFETFPQAVACALAGCPVSAKQKRTIRRSLLERLGLPIQEFTNIDWVDAVLCAVAARALAGGSIRAYGDAASGFIVVPGSAI